MEADNSIWRKTGHFYFALTRSRPEIFSRSLEKPMISMFFSAGGGVHAKKVMGHAALRSDRRSQKS
jgi:hypothetical protein